MKKEKWYMYVLSCKDKTYYCGISTDVDRRLNEHNKTKKGAKYTKSRRPSVLIYVEEHESRSAAAKAEARFKKMSRRQKMVYMVASYEERYANQEKEWKKSLEKDLRSDCTMGDHDSNVDTH